MEQLNLFDYAERNYKGLLEEMIDALIIEMRLPAKSIQYNEQVDNINPGEYLLQISEEEWPRNPARSQPQCVVSPILIIKEERKGKYAGSLKITMKDWQYEKIQLPESVLSITKATDGKTIRINQDDPALIPYLREHIIYKLSKYQSSASFSCCSQFNRCSDEKHCVHENLLYATGCQYRRNLDAGRIFYGKNRNVDND